MDRAWDLNTDHDFSISLPRGIAPMRTLLTKTTLNLRSGGN